MHGKTTLALALLIAGGSQLSGQFSGAIFTTTSSGTTVNANIYELRTDVYLNGGPQGNNFAGLPNGTYYFQVTNPSGSVLLSTDNAVCRQVAVNGGRVVGSVGPCPHAEGAFNPANGSTPVQLWPYDITPNHGGEYKAWLIRQTANTSVDAGDPTVLHFLISDTKTDNFKVKESDGNGGGGPPQEVVIILGRKFYDRNTDGDRDAGEPGIPGWRIEKAPPAPHDITYTDINGIYGFLVGTNSGSYTISEVMPAGSWLATTPTSALVGPVGTHDVAGPDFGNVCLGAGGGRTKGFWTNKNGQSLFGSTDLAQMAALNLRDAAGNHFDPGSYSAFKDWLNLAYATNMAYMLSAQLAAMRLNVFNGLASGSALIYAPGASSANGAGFASVNAVVSEANAELGVHGTAWSGDPWRSYQEALKNALDRANNNLTFVQASPCAFITPY
jgi:hypothetical protein